MLWSIAKMLYMNIFLIKFMLKKIKIKKGIFELEMNLKNQTNAQQLISRNSVLPLLNAQQFKK